MNRLNVLRISNGWLLDEIEPNGVTSGMWMFPDGAGVASFVADYCRRIDGPAEDAPPSAEPVPVTEVFNEPWCPDAIGGADPADPPPEPYKPLL